MKSFGKWIAILGGLVAVVAMANGVRYVYTHSKEALTTPDGRYDVVDGMVGKIAVDRFLEIKEKRDTFNLPAFKTSLVMFYTQHGRYPRDMQELTQSGDLSPDLARDRFGNPFQLKIFNHKIAIVESAGPDKIKGTTDDIRYDIPME